jgi:hypothetical protein
MWWWWMWWRMWRLSYDKVKLSTMNLQLSVWLGGWLVAKPAFRTPCIVD